MSGWWVLALLLLSSSVPVLAVYFWFRITRYPFSTIRFLFALITGAAAFFPALVLQSFFPSGFHIAGRLGLLVDMFFPIAITEEFSRLIVFLLFVFISGKIDARRGSLPSINSDGSAQAPGASSNPANTSPPAGYGTLVYGSAAGLVAGFGFALLESAAYGAADPGITLFRIFTSAPIHGTCGARVGSAALLFRTNPAQGLFRFLSAVMIHGIYNFLIVIPGLASVAAVLIAVFSLASTVLTIHSGMKPGKSISDNTIDNA